MIDNISAERLLQQLHEQISKQQLPLQTAAISTDNVFSVFGAVRKEVPYCRVLLYLIREYWQSFAATVLKCCGNEPLRSSETEHPCNAPCAQYDKDGRIDIFLETDHHVVAIEVKIGAAEQANQLVRYYKELKNTYPQKQAHIFYLTLDGKASATCICENYTDRCSELCRADYIGISFTREISDWLAPIVSGQPSNLIAAHFWEVLKMEQNYGKDYADILEKSRQYPQIIRAFSDAMPILWERIRREFLNALTKVLCQDYGFHVTERETAHNHEVWAVTLEKADCTLHLCYETNFFIRSGANSKKWCYISSDAFGDEANTALCHSNPKKAFSLKYFDDSNEGLVTWYYHRDHQTIQRIAESINSFVCSQ